VTSVRDELVATSEIPRLDGLVGRDELAATSQIGKLDRLSRGPWTFRTTSSYDAQMRARGRGTGEMVQKVQGPDSRRGHEGHKP